MRKVIQEREGYIQKGDSALIDGDKGSSAMATPLGNVPRGSEVSQVLMKK